MIMQKLADEYAVTSAEAVQNSKDPERYGCLIVVDGKLLAGRCGTAHR